MKVGRQGALGAPLSSRLLLFESGVFGGARVVERVDQCFGEGFVRGGIPYWLGRRGDGLA